MVMCADPADAVTNRCIQCTIIVACEYAASTGGQIAGDDARKGGIVDHGLPAERRRMAVLTAIGDRQLVSEGERGGVMAHRLRTPRNIAGSGGGACKTTASGDYRPVQRI